MKCSFCEKEIREKISFGNFLVAKSKFNLCEECKEIININEYKVEEKSLYYFAEYDDFKELIYEIKYFGTLHSAKKLEGLFKNFFKNRKFDIVTIVPANKIRKYIRSFDQVEEICKICNVKYTKIFYCDYRPKQAKLHKKRLEHKFYIFEEFLEKYKNKDVKTILIIDDVFTSGKTLLSCAKELEKIYPNAKISFLTLSFAAKKQNKV